MRRMGDIRNAYGIFAGKQERNPLGGSRRTWVNNVKINLMDFSPSRKIPRYYFKPSNDHFISCYFQFTVC